MKKNNFIVDTFSLIMMATSLLLSKPFDIDHFPDEFIK